MKYHKNKMWKNYSQTKMRSLILRPLFTEKQDRFCIINLELTMSLTSYLSTHDC